MQPSTTLSPAAEIYHQIIPHFILSQFNFVPSDSLREKVRNHWRTQSVRGEQLFVYDLRTGKLRRRPSEYSKLDAFKDPKNPTDVKCLEKKLRDLEHDAATIVRHIHYRLGDGAITLTRERLSILRKFIFVTHYRRLAVHIQEAEVEAIRSSQSRVEGWLRGLEYYLDTPHYDIVATGERLRERYGNSLSDMRKNQSYPDDEKLAFQYALDYEHLANYYFLGVWEAAEENEFVLGGHAFGLKEGLIRGRLGAHIVHVLSPRIAIILRSTRLHHPKYNQPGVLYSSLADVTISQPLTQYANKDVIEIVEADPANAKEFMDAYRATPEAQEDTFKYTFTRLSPKQTYSVNEVIMMSANQGSVIFRRPSVMRGTVDLYMASHNTFLARRQCLFHPLSEQLSALDSQVRSSSSPPDASESTPDCQLSMLLSFMLKNYIVFPSAYTRAFLVYHMAAVGSPSNPISLRMRKIRDTATDKLRCILDPPLPENLLRARSSSTSSELLVQSLDSEESELFFSLIAPLLDQANASIRRTNDFFTTVINEAAIIGVIYWLADERPDVLRETLTDWVDIWA